MSTRTTGKRETLEERIRHRHNKQRKQYKSICYSCDDHIRAELQRVARQVRKLYQTQGQFYGDGTCVRRADVLALLKEAGR